MEINLTWDQASSPIHLHYPMNKLPLTSQYIIPKMMKRCTNICLELHIQVPSTTLRCYSPISSTGFTATHKGRTGLVCLGCTKPRYLKFENGAQPGL